MTVSEKRKLFFTFLIPVLFCLLCILVKVIEVVFEVNLATFGVYPREIKGIIGVFTSPIIHGDFKHLFGNMVPLFILSAGLFYYYRPIGYKTFLTIYLATGFWVWISARPSYHIGASGVVYGLASFHFISGIIRGNKMLMAFSLLVVFLYGSLIWGILPVDPVISWESHLLGGVAGALCAISFRKYGPQKEKHEWPDEDEEWNEPREEEPVTITYEFVESVKKDKEQTNGKA